MPDPRGAAVGLDVGEPRLDGEVVSVEDALVAGESPPQRHRLRGGEGGVVAGDGLNDASVLAELVPERVPETVPGGGVVSGQQGFELVLGDRAGQPEPGSLASLPLTGRFVAVLGVEVVGVAGVVAGGFARAGGVDRSHTEHV